MTQRVLVTGAAGFVGRNIVQALVEAGYAVLALDHRFDDDTLSTWQNDTGDHVEILNTGVSNLPEIDVDAVIHGAAITASPEEIGQTPEENYRANSDAVLDVLHWAAQRHVKRTIILSSSAVYRATAVGPVDETMPTTPLGLYATAKDAAERLVETLRTEYGRDVVIARLSNIYGPYERARASRPRTSLVAQMVQTALAENLLTVYQQDDALDWTYAPDIGRAIERILAAQQLQHHVYNAASEQVLTPVDIAQGIKAALPAVEVVIHQGRDPKSTLRTRLGYLSSQRLRSELGFDTWTRFEQGIQTVMTWQQTERVQ